MNSIFRSSAYLLASIWFIYGVQAFVHLEHFGIRPRSLSGLLGVLLSPLLHGNLSHIVSNSISLLFLAPFFFFVTNNRRHIFFEIWLLSGLFTWAIGRSNSVHIGASSIIFGMIGLLLGIGVFKKNLWSISVSALTFFLYGSALWGLLPTNPFISWEGHLGGFISGLISAKHSMGSRNT